MATEAVAPERTTFSSGDGTCAASLFRAVNDAFEGPRGRPVVVMGHGFAATRDCGLDAFAERFAAAGLDALTFDYRHFGESSGEPRQLLSIPRQLQDFTTAVEYACALEGTDADRVVVWGSSYAGGHAVEVAAKDRRVAAVVAQVPAMDGVAVLRRLIGYAGPARLARLTLAGLRDAARAALGRPPLMLPAVGPPGTLAAMSTPDAEEGMRAIAGPTWRNEVCARIMLRAGAYRPGLCAGELPCPILIQLADTDSVAPVDAAEAAASRATGRAEVRRYPIGHFEIYRGAPFERAVADQLHFLRRHLVTRARERPQARKTRTASQPIV
jgi:uncharacterized protein